MSPYPYKYDKSTLSEWSEKLVSVFLSGPYPLKTWWFEFAPQVTVLYGLNGSGKTRLLRALSLAGEGHEGHELVTKIKSPFSEDEFNDLTEDELASLYYERVYGETLGPEFSDTPLGVLKGKTWVAEIFEQDFHFAYKQGFGELPGELDEALENYEMGRAGSEDRVFLASSRRETVEKVLNSNWGKWRGDLEDLPISDRGWPVPPDDSEFTLREKLLADDFIRPDWYYDQELIMNSGSDPEADAEGVMSPLDPELLLANLVFHLDYGFHSSEFFIEKQYDSEVLGSKILTGELNRNGHRLPPKWAPVSVAEIFNAKFILSSPLEGRIFCDPPNLHSSELPVVDVKNLDELTNERAHSLLSQLWWDKRFEKSREMYAERYGEKFEKNEEGFVRITADGPADPFYFVEDPAWPIYEEGQWPLEINSELLDLFKSISDAANDVLSYLLVNPPELVFHTWHPSELINHGNFGHWLVADLVTGDRYEISSLSQAERRWTLFALRFALNTKGVRLLLIDEPELGLHETAVRHLCKGLQRISEEKDINVVLASHSAQFIKDENIRKLHVSRGGDGVIETHEWNSSKVNERGLGLERSELLLLTKRFLVVEGVHDKEVLNTLIGDQLRELDTHIFSMSGTGNIVTFADSELLYDLTDAAIVVVVDNAKIEKVNSWVDQIQSLMARKGKTSDREIHDWERNAREGASPEEKSILKFLKNLAFKESSNLLLQRVGIFGFEKEDIIEYLDCKSLVPDQNEWESLREKFETNGRGAWKKWLSKEYGASFELGDIKRATEKLDHIPKEFFDLLQLLNSLPMRVKKISE